MSLVSVISHPRQHTHLPPTRTFASSSALYGNRHVQFVSSHKNYKRMVPTRCAHHKRNIWDYDFIESLHSDHKAKSYIERFEKLKEEVKEMLLVDDANANDMVGSSLGKLEVIDSMQRLGVGYHFENEIKSTLEKIFRFKESSGTLPVDHHDLHSVALSFRLLRQHGYQVSQDVFNDFKDNNDNFQEGISNDVKGMLSLYEASHLCLEGEDIMTEARAFTTRQLQLVKLNVYDSNLAQYVTHALELPLHWRMPRWEGRWSIDAAAALGDQEKICPSLFELAILDFNLVQATHQKELSNMTRWWRDLDLAKNLSFARDRLVESFLWSVGVTYEPQNERCREWLTKFTSLALTIDDIYDIYGSFDELDLFSNAVERWDEEAAEQLPDYMKICYLALYNTTNDMACTVYKEQSSDILPYLKKGWIDFCQAMLLEAKWSKDGYVPSLMEYLSNAWMSSSVPVGLVHAFFASKQTITDDVLKCLYENNELMHASSMIFRLCNDLATSSAESERGDVPSAIQCYMKETNTSEQVARQKIEGLVTDMWKTVNKSLYDSPFNPSFVDLVMNNVRTTCSIYLRGDGVGVQDHEAKQLVKKLLFIPTSSALGKSDVPLG